MAFFSSSETSDLKNKWTHERRFRPLNRLEELLVAFTPGERMILYGCGVILALSTFVLIALLNASVSVTVPTAGGSLSEGMLGPARFLNPVLATSQADQDLTSLVYSGLTRATPDGRIVLDLAENYTVSPDGTTYTFKIRANATFSDGTPVTSKDVAYTVTEAQDPDVKSPRLADWQGVQVSTPDAKTVVFKLPKNYAPFIDDTTMGVLPEHLWGAIDAEEFPFSPLNMHPVGSGPYKVSSVDTDATGAPVRYSLVPNTAFALGTPYLNHLTLSFFANEDAEISAFNNHEIDALAGLAPAQLPLLKRTDVQIKTAPLERIFGIFFNQNHSAVLADAAARAALSEAIDNDRLIAMVLSGYGIPLSSPLLPNDVQVASSSAVSTAYTQSTIAAAKATLQSGGWSFQSASGTWTKGKQTLTFTLSTADTPELVQTADAVATAWRQVGVQVSVQVYPLADLNATVLRPRNYDAILFGEVIGRSLDLYAFWHSTQRNDPGLNLALYANSKADTLLAQARATTEPKDRDKLFSQFVQILSKDQPAVFLYAPEFIYVVPNNVQGMQLGKMSAPSERFLGVYQWYTDTEHVWSIFTDRSEGSTT